ncbi:unnamed protein product [Symbiodinium sp. CCMP2592]|nr:unnamed protein product [Symbiodinium sp. CCMP2592]
MGKANRLQRGKQHKGRRTRETPRPEESVAAAKAGPGPAPSGSSSSGTTFKVLVLAPRRFIRLFEAHPPYLAGTPGVILPDDIPGTPLSTTTAPLAGDPYFSEIVQERLYRLYRWVVSPPPPSRYVRPPPALAPTQVDGREDSDRTARPTVQIHSDSDTDEEDVVVLLPGPGGQEKLPEVISTASSLEPPASSSSQCTPPASGPEKRRQLLANVVMRAAEDGSLAKALSRVRWPESEDAPPGHTDSESDTVEALEPGDGLPPPSPENILRADPAASTLLSHTFQGISPPENMLESVPEMVKLLPASVASQDPPSTCQPLPTRRWRRRQLSQLEAEAEAHAKADPPTVTSKGLPSRSPFSPITRTDTKRVRPEKRSSASSSNDDSSSGRSGRSQGHEPRRFTDTGMTQPGTPTSPAYMRASSASPVRAFMRLAVVMFSLPRSLGAVHGQWSFCVALSLQRYLHLPASCHTHQWSPQQAMLLPPSRFSPQPHAGASFSGPWHLFASGQPVVPPDTVLRNLVHRTQPDRSKLPSDIPTTPSWFASDPDEVRASDSDQIDREMAARGLPPPPVPPLCENDEPRGPPPPRPVRYDDAPGSLSESEGPCITDSSSLLSLVAAANGVGYQDVVTADLLPQLSRPRWVSDALESSDAKGESLQDGVSSILQAPSDAHATGIKRAYNRAVRRAQASPLQGTFYRGRWCSFRAPVLSPQPRMDRRPQLHAAAPASAARLLHVSYNAGGLTGESYQELMQWLAQLPPEQCPMIVHIQETHWSHDQEYSTPGWHIISSACSSPKAGGLLTLVSAQLCSANQISSSSRVAGRLLHVRIDLGDRTVDAINTYQKVYHSGSTRIEKGQTQTAADQRMGVWTSLRGLLKEIPIRHHLILSGDFNSPAPLISELVGSKGASQIDHVFVRKATADMPARGGSPVTGLWRLGDKGAYATPVATRVIPEFGTFVYVASLSLLAAWTDDRTREAKRAWFHDQIPGMERASAVGDVSPNDELWSPTQQVDCLKTFFQDLYAPEDEPALPPLPHPRRRLLPVLIFLRPGSVTRSVIQYSHDNYALSGSQKARAVFWPDAAQGRRCIVCSATVTKCWHTLIPFLCLQAETAQVPIELRVQLLEFYRGLLMRRLARATSSEWVRRALTAFADDFHIGQVVYSTRDLLLSIDRLGHVLQLLIDARMKVNIDKSVILLSVNHSYASRWRRREILSDKEGPRLRISTPTAGTFKMPIVSTHKYLGAIISYQEDQRELGLFQNFTTPPAGMDASASTMTFASTSSEPKGKGKGKQPKGKVLVQRPLLDFLRRPDRSNGPSPSPPLRTLLLRATLQEMETRIKLTISKEKQTAIDMQWYKEEEGWTYMQWNAQKGQLELQATPSPLATETLLELLRELPTLVNPDSVKKFASLRGLPQEPQSEWIHFQLELGFRPQGDRMWEIFQMLLNQSCLHPLGARLRKDRPGLSGLAAQIQQAVGEVPLHFQPLLRAVLHNADGTACYMNTAFIALLWALGCYDPARSGSLCSLYQCLTARSDLRLMRNMCWTMLLGNWARPNQQHDMHEFLLHLMPRVRLEAFSGLWQTRRLEDTGTVVCASSSALLPVTVDLPLEARGLQHCVQEWSARHYHTAFDGTMPHLLCLHLSRYRRDDERGILSKDDQALPDWSEVLRIPQFATSHDLQKHWRPYQVCAMALHYGPALHQGHYRCMTRWGQNPVRVWLHDDNRAAVPLSLPDSVELSRKAYLIWAVRMD